MGLFLIPCRSGGLPGEAMATDQAEVSNNQASTMPDPVGAMFFKGLRLAMGAGVHDSSALQSCAHTKQAIKAVSGPERGN